MNYTDSQLVALFKALGDPTRLRIIRLFFDQKMLCVTQIAKQCSISLPSASQHLKILEHAQLVQKERIGKLMCYRFCKKDAFVNKALNLTKHIECV
ncbi:winged helix-turn-helix transcriptional regulator [Candidatus Uhrbacteria bacterium]|nr:winged helix-turn-helix transcriptional regulator [Candidatus Uhrbacteria bacterium]